MSRGILRPVLLALAVLVAACGSSLPDADQPGARVMQTRCVGCHRLYPPASMTLDMWRFQVERMREQFARRGLPWLAPSEESALLDYLASHAGKS